jgi:hypothetical protein
VKKKLAALLTATLSCLGMLAVANAVPAAATGKVKCDVLPSGAEDNDGDVAVKVGQFDPIVFHNVESQDPSEAQPHSHDFFGSRAVNITADPNALQYAQVRAQGNGAAATSCRDPKDTAVYWAPSLVYKSGPNAGQRVGVQQFTAYYRGYNGQTTNTATEVFPPGVRLVAQQSGNAGGGPGKGLTGWTCGQNSTVTGGQATIPDCSHEDGTPGNTLTAHINFPSCWNGVLPNHPGDGGTVQTDNTYGDTRDNNYGVAGTYTSNDWKYPSSSGVCPTGYTHKVMQLRETIQYNYTGTGTDVELSSDHGAAPGSTMHVDFWNTWDQTGLVALLNNCIKVQGAASLCDR